MHENAGIASRWLRAMSSVIWTALVFAVLLQLTGAQIVQPPRPGPLPNINPGPDSNVLFTGTGTNPYYGVNLVPFGPENGDLEVRL